MYAIPRADAERLVLEHHGTRIANLRNRRAAWRVVGGRLIVLYDHPDDGDWLTAVIVTLWRNR